MVRLFKWKWTIPYPSLLQTCSRQSFHAYSLTEALTNACGQLLQNAPMTIDDFDLLKVIGKGSFGKVRISVP